MKLKIKCKLLVVAIFMLLSTSYINAQEDFYQHGNIGLGATTGMQNPYGLFGLEISYLFSDILDLNAGVGVGFSGVKTGVGLRIFLPNKDVSPYLGANFIYATGGKEIEVRRGGETGYFDIPKGSAIHVKGGVKIRFFFDQWLYLSGGYAFSRNDKEAEFLYGSDSEKIQNFANFSTIGGVQASATFIFKFFGNKANSKKSSWGQD